MTGSIPTVEVLTGPKRRRRWTTARKLATVGEAHGSDVTVSLVARRQGVQPNQILRWRKLAAQGASAAAAEGVRWWPHPSIGRGETMRELQRLLGQKTMEAEILKDALDVAAGSRKQMLRSLSWPKDGSR